MDIVYRWAFSIDDDTVIVFSRPLLPPGGTSAPEPADGSPPTTAGKESLGSESLGATPPPSLSVIVLAEEERGEEVAEVDMGGEEDEGKTGTEASDLTHKNTEDAINTGVSRGDGVRRGEVG